MKKNRLQNQIYEECKFKNGKLKTLSLLPQLLLLPIVRPPHDLSIERYAAILCAVSFAAKPCAACFQMCPLLVVPVPDTSTAIAVTAAGCVTTRVQGISANICAAKDTSATM
jgi:hypothetical protein